LPDFQAALTKNPKIEDGCTFTAQVSAKAIALSLA
jgi:hypothetical protein